MTEFSRSLLSFSKTLIRKIELYFRSDRTESKPIELIERNGKTYAKVKDLRRHPLNDLIYTKANVERLLSQIKSKGWIKTLTIKPDGTIVSGNSRYECAEILSWEEVEVEVEEFEFKWQEVTRLLMENDYRLKTRVENGREGLVWEWSEKEEAAERRRATQNNKSNVDEGADVSNLTLQTEKSTKKGKARDFAAKQVDLKPINYQKIKKVIVAADRLDAENRKGAAKRLLDTLNNKSTDAAYKQIKELDRVKNKIASLKGNEQLKEAQELNTILKNHNIKEAVFLMDTWERERRKKEAKFQHNDVVRIKGKEHQGEWAILDIYDSDKDTGIIQTVLGDFHERLVNLEKIQLSDEEKAAARQLMERLQNASYSLQTQGRSLGHKIIQDLLKKPHPLLNDFEESMLQTIENLNTNKELKDLPAEEINTNSVLNSFLKNLDRFGIEDIRVIARAIASRKQEAIVEATINLADSEDKAKQIVQVLLQKYPNAI